MSHTLITVRRYMPNCLFLFLSIYCLKEDQFNFHFTKLLLYFGYTKYCEGIFPLTLFIWIFIFHFIWNISSSLFFDLGGHCWWMWISKESFLLLTCHLMFLLNQNTGVRMYNWTMYWNYLQVYIWSNGINFLSKVFSICSFTSGKACYVFIE